MLEVRGKTGKNLKARDSRGRVDAWQTAVYAFEYAWEDWRRKTLTFEEVKIGIRRACRAYGVRPPAVRVHKGRAYSWSDGDTISLRSAHMNPAIALHEAAHHIVYAVFGDSMPDHDPVFQGVYFWLLNAACLAPAPALRAAARSYGLKWRLMSPELVRHLQKACQAS